MGGKHNWRQLLVALAWICLFLLTGNLHKQLSSYIDYGQDASLLSSTNHADEDIILDPLTNPKPVDTLVHFDPYFMGGFRNQHMRFVAFVNFAVQNNISQILLPSIRWGDNFKKTSVHHELLFDVPYWNSRAGEAGLPLLVNYDPEVLEGVFPNSGSNSSGMPLAPVIPCWNEDSDLYFGLDMWKYRNRNTNLRRMNAWAEIGQMEPYLHCRRTPGPDGENNHKTLAEEASKEVNSTKVHRFTHLIPHGGQKSSGRLWFDYSAMQSNRGKASETVTIHNQTVQIHPEHVSVEQAVYDLLRPSRNIRLAIKKAIDEAMLYHTTSVKSRPPRLLALHPRVEQDMISHKCSRLMEKSLKRVFDRMQLYEPLHDHLGNFRFDLVFIAINKAEMERETWRKDEIGQLINENRETLFHVRRHGLFSVGGGGGSTNSTSKGIPIFESGVDSAAKLEFRYLQPTSKDHTVSNVSLATTNNDSEEPVVFTAKSLDAVALAASIIDFFTAVQADVFIGVKGSTYSTDVFSVRYYQHKHEEGGGGAENYVVGPEGIERLYGPAAPHSC